LVCFIEGTSGTASWARRYPADGADAAATGEWAATAATAAAAARGEPAAVIGEGVLAALIRLALPADGRLDAAPRVVIETTGTAAGLAEALRRVERRGRVMLATRPLHAATALRTYHDLHRPGVSLLSVPWACCGARPAPGHLRAWALARLAAAESGRPARFALWHRLTVDG
jgi:hypothetical protein